MILRWLLPLILLFALVAASAAAPRVLWLEAEQFHDCGGWVNDSQFIDQMGSSYLLAAGLGRPVQDAVTKLELPSGRYRLWARIRDWIPQHHPGRFQILVGGKPCQRTFGQNGQPGWCWEDGGLHDLSGEVELRLHDLTGYYGRCDVVLLTDGLSWQPPLEAEPLAAARRQYGGVSSQIHETGHFDVVVVGGGLAGCVAAVSAARSGAPTVLIQNRPVLGGNASVEILVPPVGVWPYHRPRNPLDPRETGVVEEFRGRGVQTLDEAKVYSGRLLRLVRGEPNVALHLNTHVTGVEMADPTTIGSVVAVDTRTGQRMRFAGTVFVDCTGDGTVGAAAGAEYRHGREPRSMYHESMAPERGDHHTMGNSLKYASVPESSAQPFEPPAWAMHFATCDSFPPGRHPRLARDIEWQWKIELGGTRNTYRDAEEIRDQLLRLVYGMWDHTKNHCSELGQKAANHRLAWVGHVAGKRESMRLLGDYVLTQNDITGQTLFDDRVAFGGWGVDDHHPEGFFYDGRPAQHDYHGLIHSIPFRCLYSRNVDNLLMAGRNISASHVAMSATRVMLTCAVMGQASGTAAALCIEHQTTPRGLYEHHLARLQQQLLKDGAHIPALPNQDTSDLARSAAVHASTEMAGSDGASMVARNVINGYARADDHQSNGWMPAAKHPLPQWIELTWDRPQTLNVVHVTFLNKRCAPSRFALEAWLDGRWLPLAEVTANVHRRHVLGFERTTSPKLRLVLLEAGLQDPGVCEIRVYDEPRRQLEIAQRRRRNLDAPDGDPGLPWDDVAWITGIDPHTLRGIVLDSSQGEITGQWVRSEHTRPFVGDGYLHDGNTGKGAKSIRFRPNVPRAGTYELRIAYSPFANRAANVPVTVTTPRGSQTLHIDQRRKPPIDGLFLSLGNFELNAGTSTVIVVGNAGAEGYVSVDALQLLGP